MKAFDKLRRAKEFLESSGIDDANREAELIASHCLGIDRIILYKDNPPIPENVLLEMDELLKRRSRREPLQYILGYTEFCGLKIKVGPGVLIPRPETEFLAEEAIKVFKERRSETASPPHPPLIKGGVRGGRILDLCTGSGCLALAIAKEFPDSEVYGTDTSEVAINYAGENARINSIKNVTFLRGSLFEPLKEILKFDLIVSNPPYIRRNDIQYLQSEIKEWEPLEALDGGEDGLDYYKVIIPEARNYLSGYGFLMFEMGIGQAEDVKKIARDAGFSDICLIKDYAGIERIVILAKEQR